MSAPDPIAAAIALDQQARVQALDVTRSMLLQAPAGSGKTTVLTARFLALLCAVDAPEEILAITFTRKAAAEMRHRVLQALRAADAGRPVDGIEMALLQAAAARDRQQGWELLRNPARLRIETIDALNQWLARQAPIAAHSGATLTIANTPAPLYQRAARRALEGALQDEAAAAAELLFERLDNHWGRLEGLLAQMLERRTHWLPQVLETGAGELLERVQASVQSLLRAELAAALALLPPALRAESEQILALTRAARGDAVSNVQLTAEPGALPLWRALCALALTDKGWRARFTVKEGVGPGNAALKQRVIEWSNALQQVAGLEPCLSELRLLPDASLTDADQAALRALALLLLRAAAELQWVFASQGRVDYAYVAAAARAALTEDGQPSDFALRAGSALRHLLIDEFQDTSYEQIGLVRALTAGWERGDGRTLFVVGDPMQSIYQFREAEVGLFLQARSAGIGEIDFEALSLRRNFRSQPALIHWVNQQFEQLFPPVDDPRLAAIRYLPSVPGVADTGAAGVQLHDLDPAQATAEAVRVLQIVERARAANAQASIAVLVASREHAAPIAAQLRDAGFALRGVDLERLRDREVVRDLSALTRALLHRADRTAWLALLRAPWCGLTLAQLELASAEGSGDLYARMLALAADERFDDQARARLARLGTALAPALTGIERNLPLWQRVEHCWWRLGGPALYAQALDRLDVRRYLDALAQHDAPEELAGEALIALTERLFSQAPPVTGAIEVMTMHAAKGLEWDVVILPSLGRRTAIDTDPLLHWIELPRPDRGTELLLAPIRAQERDARGSLPGYIKHVRRRRSRLERVRLLYVAATRARRELHLLGSLQRHTTREAAPPAGSLLEILWPALAPHWPAASPQAGEDGVAASATALRRLAAHWRLPDAPVPPQTQRLALTQSSPLEGLEYSWVGLSARAVGTIVHAELHRLAAQPEAGTPDYARWLADLGVDPDEHARASARIREAIERTRADERGRWLLSRSHREAHSERRLSGVHEGRVVNIIVDRMLVDEQGQRWIIDFKTSTHEGGAIEEFLQSEQQRYAPQLRRYATLAAQLGPEPVRLALYFPLLGVFREVIVD